MGLDRKSLAIVAAITREIYIKPLRRKFNQHLRGKLPLITGAKILIIFGIARKYQLFMQKVARLKAAYEHLKSLGKVHKQKDVSEKMEVSASNISKAFNGNKRFLTDNFLIRFNRTYGNIFNDVWLIDGTGEMLSSVDSPEIEDKDGKIKFDFKKLWEIQEKKGVGKEWRKLYFEAPETRKSVVERIRVAMPEAKNVKPSIIFQHLAETNPTLALWAATGKDDKVVVNRSIYETALAKLATLERLAEIQSKELRELKGESNIEPIAKLF